jgi:hypothetical protein
MRLSIPFDDQDSFFPRLQGHLQTTGNLPLAPQGLHEPSGRSCISVANPAAASSIPSLHNRLPDDLSAAELNEGGA